VSVINFFRTLDGSCVRVYTPPYMKNTFVHFVGWSYRAVAPLIFLADSEPAHDFVLDMSEFMGKIPGVPWLMRIRH